MTPYRENAIVPEPEARARLLPPLPSRWVRANAAIENFGERHPWYTLAICAGWFLFFLALARG